MGKRKREARVNFRKAVETKITLDLISGMKNRIEGAVEGKFRPPTCRT
jgi:hypothetical protein